MPDNEIPGFFTGDDWCIKIYFEEQLKDGTFKPADFSTATDISGIVSSSNDGSAGVLVPIQSFNKSAEGADWKGGCIIAEFPATDNHEQRGSGSQQIGVRSHHAPMVAYCD